ncbi:uncharacterized protein LOC127353140 [Dicentrarchus labrax]|uniref:uncharacterized protein LOC127353140 n=1 Tax=Dicentrarchus labrax TaxID=13489 RepID=UPI0021F59E2C|nr:uncharacterized protein LOC127353140 [Dicentrarchus labrax]XP_051238136.1 uncharacterized protein LOC127353140 [Dicentrarchus labrax]
MPGKCAFNISWLSKDRYKLWLETEQENDQHARCKLCKKSFDVSNMGEAALTSHAKGTKHIQHEKTARDGLPIQAFFNSTKTTARPASGPGSVSNMSVVATAKQSTLNVIPAPTATAASAAEILWADSHYSYNSCSNVGGLFSRMFPDSEIARQFRCGSTKAAYLNTFGVAPYFKSLLVREISRQIGYVMLFDESLNHELQRKQMDLHVCIWDGGKVRTRYVGSEFFGHATARDVVDKMIPVLEGIGVKNLVQLSMDGPHVNWKIFDMLQKEVLGDVNKSLLNIGSCGLHVIHNAFRDGCKASGWDIKHALSSLYWLFKDSPARREDYTKVTGSDTFMLKFCSIVGLRTSTSAPEHFSYGHMCRHMLKRLLEKISQSPNASHIKK